MKKFMNQENMKHENCIDVFHLIKEEKQLTRKQIEAITGMSWGAVSNITARLISNGFIMEQKAGENTGRGRTPSYLEADGSRYCTLGIDVNITGMKAELVNLKSETVKTWDCETRYSCREDLLQSISRILELALADEESKKYEILGIGAAMQGVVDAENGISVNMTQCSDWNNVPLAAVLEEKYKIPVWLEHDPNCILNAYAGTHEIQNAILLRIDRGIGMAVMLDSGILEGTGRFEIARTIAAWEEGPYPGPDNGCLEDFASVNGLEKRSGMKLESLTEAAQSGDSKAMSLFQDMGMKLGISIYNMRKIFNITDVILCGGLMESERFFMDTVVRINDGARFFTADAGSACYGAAAIALNQAVGRIKL